MFENVNLAVERNIAIVLELAVPEINKHLKTTLFLDFSCNQPLLIQMSKREDTDVYATRRHHKTQS